MFGRMLIASWDWQQAAALACVAVAVVLLWRRGRRLWAARSGSACGGCNSCAAGNAPAADGSRAGPLVPLQIVPRRDAHQAGDAALPVDPQPPPRPSPGR